MKLFKPKVLVTVLSGSERHAWTNPDLLLNCVAMAVDPRFEVLFYPVRDARPWDHARNLTIIAARKLKADWLVSFDNDAFYRGPGTPLDILANAGKRDIIGLPYAMTDGQTLQMMPKVVRGPNEGQFRREHFVGGGVLMVRNTVWKTISKGPWFRWVHAESESLEPADGSRSEECFFCDVARQHGLTVWSHERLAGHYRNCDITSMYTALSREEQQENAPSLNWTTPNAVEHAESYLRRMNR